MCFCWKLPNTFDQDRVLRYTNLTCKYKVKLRTTKGEYVIARKNTAKRSKIEYNFGIFKDVKKSDINTFEFRKYSTINKMNGNPVSIGIPDTMKFVQYDGTNNIKINYAEYKFQAHFITYSQTKEQLISLCVNKNKDKSYLKITKNGRITASEKFRNFIFILEEINDKTKKQKQTKISQFYQSAESKKNNNNNNNNQIINKPQLCPPK